MTAEDRLRDKQTTYMNKYFLGSEKDGRLGLLDKTPDEGIYNMFKPKVRASYCEVKEIGKFTYEEAFDILRENYEVEAYIETIDANKYKITYHLFNKELSGMDMGKFWDYMYSEGIIKANPDPTKEPYHTTYEEAKETKLSLLLRVAEMIEWKDLEHLF